MPDVSAKAKKIQLLDAHLSRRFIQLDPSGYFLIALDPLTNELVVEHFSNDIDEKGRATDPDSGEVLRCSGGSKRIPQNVYRGFSAKQVGALMTEGEGPHPISRIDHALYLGRELQRAETCLLSGTPYIQD